MLSPAPIGSQTALNILLVEPYYGYHTFVKGVYKQIMHCIYMSSKFTLVAYKQYKGNNKGDCSSPSRPGVIGVKGVRGVLGVRELRESRESRESGES